MIHSSLLFEQQLLRLYLTFLDFPPLCSTLLYLALLHIILLSITLLLFTLFSLTYLLNLACLLTCFVLT